MLENLLHSDHSALWKSLTAIIPEYAKSSGLVQRVSARFNPAAFLLTLLSAATTGKTSLNNLAISLRGKAKSSTVSTQALHGRINRSETGLEEFLILCLAHICRWKWIRAPGQRGALCALAGCFGRVIVEDSSFLPFHKSNAEDFPAHGNSKGKTAGCKVNLAFDLLTGSIISNELVSGTQQDKTSGWDVLTVILPNDLILRDMGYFSVESFAAIEAQDAYWLSRLPLNVGASSMDGTSLESLFRKHRGECLDIRVKLTATGHTARLVAIRASGEETEKRRREINKEAKAKGRTPDGRTLLLAGWHILVTNITVEKVSAEGLAAIYSQRWQIEIVFRGWKQASGLDKALGRKSSPQHLKGLVLASMIVLAMSVRIAIGLARIEGGRYSLEKICQYLSVRLAEIKELTQLLSLQPDPRHVHTQKRRRKSLAVRYFECLG